MSTHHTYLLSNLSVNQFIEFQVTEADDVLAAARDRLQSSGLSEEVQGGFFVSVYPTGSETRPGDVDRQLVRKSSHAAPKSSTGGVPVAETAGIVQEPVVNEGSSSAPGSTSQETSPLDAAAAAGPMHWTDDPAIDPPGGPLPSERADDGTPLAVVPLGAAGGH